MTLDANTDLLDIEDVYGNNIDATELEDFKASIYNIERETFAAYNDLCTREATVAHLGRHGYLHSCDVIRVPPAWGD